VPAGVLRELRGCASEDTLSITVAITAQVARPAGARYRRARPVMRADRKATVTHRRAEQIGKAHGAGAAKTGHRGRRHSDTGQKRDLPVGRGRMAP